MSTSITNSANETNEAARLRKRASSSFDKTLRSARSTIAFRETVNLAIDSFRASKTRFLLTMLGMVIGSASIVLVYTVGNTGKDFALNTISGLGPNKVEMQYSGGITMGPDNVSTPDYMTREDMQAVRSEVPGIVASSPMLEYHDNIAVGNGITKEAMLLGVSPQYKEVRNLKVKAGRFFDDQDALSHAKVAVIVGPMARELYGSYADAVGHTISIRGIPFTIIGVFMESTDTFGTSEISEHTLLVPYEVARYFTGSDELKEIFFSMKTSGEVEPAAARITQIIHGRHYPTSEYKAQTLTDILVTMRKIANMLTIVLFLGSAITLIVSGVGIMNSMLANVQSRIREIGIRKAMGATSREIRLQFLTEAVFLSLGGGIIGTVLGLALPLSVGFFTDFAIPVSAWSAVIALATSVGVGVIFGTLPANRAAKLDPVATLKYE
ncbi:ABC transporter permease [Granulicella mallensis]|uniref:Putative ABC transport system permease protein n=1 Tax=Granulicella mallensis TaxID=940614 RepID=A0A7W8E8X0_9BACT|nr:ABC transporter permease [Granulicella mallensis]MBB5063197.1 putative ABC transport system permease protein [Granulicella mallensis]